MDENFRIDELCVIHAGGSDYHLMAGGKSISSCIGISIEAKAGEIPVTTMKLYGVPTVISYEAFQQIIEWCSAVNDQKSALQQPTAVPTPRGKRAHISQRREVRQVTTSSSSGTLDTASNETDAIAKPSTI